MIRMNRIFVAVVFALLLSTLSGCCAMRSDVVVYGHSGRVFTAPDENTALFQCARTDPPCFVDN